MTKLDDRRVDAAVKVPWTGFDLIEHFNAWMLSSAAGVDENGSRGLAWRGEVSQQVFEEAAVDLGRALSAFSEGRRGERSGARPRFPRFKKKSAARASFRVRNRNNQVRVGGSAAREVRLPTLGFIAVRECTRRLRRMIGKERAKILFATVSRRSDGRWHVTLNLEATHIHASRRHAEPHASEQVGIDRGIKTFAVVASESGSELARIENPRPLERNLWRLRRADKAASRKEPGSKNYRRARARAAKIHAHIAAIRRDFVHRESTQLAKTHGRMVLEDLCVWGLVRGTLARQIADSGWSLFASLLTYKARWYSGIVSLAPRFFPSTRTCSVCGLVGDRLPLRTRTFRCSSCGHESDRDTNAAINLARYVTPSSPRSARRR